jgi:hypothetical protein
MTTAPRDRERLLPWLSLPLVCLLCLGFWFRAGQANDIRYDGSFELADNGDCKAVIKLIPPMVVYQKLRDSVSNLYLVLRTFASSRADTETVDKKADWDDSNHSLTFSLKILGAGRNMGNHWEMQIPKEMEFSNLDEAKRTFYFNQTESNDEWSMRGMSRLVLPPAATNMRYDAGRHVASYVLPIPKGPDRLSLPLVAGLGLAGLGIVMLVLSLLLKAPTKVYVVGATAGQPPVANLPTAPPAVSEHREGE